MGGYVTDTHALVWFLEGNPKLSETCRNILLSEDATLFVPAMAIMETVDMVQKGRAALDLARLTEVLAAETRIEVVPIDQTIALLTARFQSLADIHDRCMVATTQHLLDRGLSVKLMTADRLITQSGLVPVIW